MNINNYDLNNTKEIDSERLFNKFVELTIFEKIRIYRILMNTRRKSIKKLWKERKKKTKEEKTIAHIANILDILKLTEKYSTDNHIEIGDTFKDNDIKSREELVIVWGICAELITLPDFYIAENTVDDKREQRAFNRTKKDMIDWIQKINNRNSAYFGSDKTIIEKIQEIKYIKPLTQHKEYKMMEKEYLMMMYEVEIGKKRASKIWKVLKEWAMTEKSDIEKEEIYNPFFVFVDRIYEEERVQEKQEYSEEEECFINEEVRMLSIEEQIKSSNFFLDIKNIIVNKIKKETLETI